MVRITAEGGVDPGICFPNCSVMDSCNPLLLNFCMKSKSSKYHITTDVFLKTPVCVLAALIFFALPAGAQVLTDDLKDISFPQAQERLQTCENKGVKGLEKEMQEGFYVADHLERYGNCSDIKKEGNLLRLCLARQAFVLDTFKSETEFKDFLEDISQFFSEDYLLTIQANFYSDPSYCSAVLDEKIHTVCKSIFSDDITTLLEQSGIKGPDAQIVSNNFYYIHAFRSKDVRLCDRISSVEPKFVCKSLLLTSEESKKQALYDFIQESCFSQTAGVLAFAAQLDPEAVSEDVDFCEKIPDKNGWKNDLYFECKDLVEQAKIFLVTTPLEQN